MRTSCCTRSFGRRRSTRVPPAPGSAGEGINDFGGFCGGLHDANSSPTATSACPALQTSHADRNESSTAARCASNTSHSAALGNRIKEGLGRNWSQGPRFFPGRGPQARRGFGAAHRGWRGSSNEIRPVGLSPGRKRPISPQDFQLMAVGEYARNNTPGWRSLDLPCIEPPRATHWQGKGNQTQRSVAPERPPIRKFRDASTRQIAENC